MHILGLDFATKTGVAFGDAGSPPSRIQTETWSLPGGDADDVGPIMHAMRERLEDRLMRGVELVVFEAPYTAKHRNAMGRWVEAPNQTRRAYGFAAICEEAAYARGIPCLEIVTVTLKKEFAGTGKAKKPDMVLAAKRRGFIVANDHEADACGCFLHGVNVYAKQFAHLYDPINQFTRGRK